MIKVTRQFLELGILNKLQFINKTIVLMYLFITIAKTISMYSTYIIRGAHNWYAGMHDARHKSELRKVICVTKRLCVPQNIKTKHIFHLHVFLVNTQWSKLRDMSKNPKTLSSYVAVSLPAKNLLTFGD